MATDLAKKIITSKRIRMTLATGQGKTMVYLLTAMVLNKYDNRKFKTFLFLTTSNALKKQLDYILANHQVDINFRTFA